MPLGWGYPALLMACVAGVTPASAQLTGGHVVQGQASIAGGGGANTVITQTSQKAIINWQDFSIASGQAVQFAQPNAASITLNRVTGTAASAIQGSLTANGQVWLINPNGVLFGHGANINVGGILATTADISNSDFAAGNYAFSTGTGNGSIVNNGAIRTARGGSAIFSAPVVTNNGLIQAQAGHVVLGGADAFTVDFNGDHLLSYQVNQPVARETKDANGNPQSAKVTNNGVIRAAGGTVLMTARAAANITDSVVNNTGMVEATSAHLENGEVVLDAGDGDTTSSGSINTAGTKAGETGGTVELLGKTVTVADGAKINASGDAGGGTVLIGGNLHGAGPQANAVTTTVGKASIRADAIRHGNGGTVAIYSTGTTQFNGAVSARGGAISGNGGQVETSGAILHVSDGATVNTSAPHGTAGDWLLDPDDLYICESLEGDCAGIYDQNIYYDDQDTTISSNEVSNNLVNGNVTLQANDDITIGGSIYADNSGHTLELDAGRSIIISNNNVTIENVGNGGTVTLFANNQGATLSGRGSGAGGISGPINIGADNINLIIGTAGTAGTIGSSGSYANVSGGVYVQTSGTDAYLSNAGGGYPGDVSLGNSGSQGSLAVNLTGTSTVGDLYVTANGLSQSGAIAVNNLIVDATQGAGYGADGDPVTLNQAGNAIAGYADIRAQGGYYGQNQITLVTGGDLDVKRAQNAQGSNSFGSNDYGDISLTATGGAMTLDGPVEGNRITLSSYGAITETANGSITSHTDSNVTNPGELTLTSQTGGISLNYSNTIQQVTAQYGNGDAEEVTSPGQISATADGDISIALQNSDVNVNSLTSTSGGISLDLGGSYQLPTVNYNPLQTYYPNLAINGPVSAATTVSLTVGNAITQAADAGNNNAISSGGAFSATSTNGGAIHLDDSGSQSLPGNAIAGNVSIMTSGDISLSNTLDTTVLRANDGIDPATGNIQTAGAIDFEIHDPTGATSPKLVIGASFDVDNNSVSHATSLDAAGDITLRADGNISDNNMDETAAGAHVSTPGTLSATSGAGSVSLNNDFNVLSFLQGSTNGGNFSVTATSFSTANLVIGTGGISAGSGNITLTGYNAGISSDAATIISGNRLTATTLDSAYNSCTSSCSPTPYAISLPAENQVSSATLNATGDITFVNSGDLVLSASSLTGSFNVSADGQNGADVASSLHVAQASGVGTSVLNANGDIQMADSSSGSIVSDSLVLGSTTGSIGNIEVPVRIAAGTVQGYAPEGSIFLSANEGFEIQYAGASAEGNLIGTTGGMVAAGSVRISIGGGGGDLTQDESGASGIQATDLSVYNQSSGDITLNAPDNYVSGHLSLSGQGNIGFTNNDSITLDQALAPNGAVTLTSTAAGIDIDGPIVSGDTITLTAVGDIAQHPASGVDTSLFVTGNLLATSTTGELLLNDGGDDESDLGNRIGGYVLLNSAADTYFTNTQDTVLGGVWYPNGAPNGYQSPDSYIGGTLDVEVTNANEAEGSNARLILAGHVHVTGANSDSPAILHAAGDIDNNSGSGDILADYMSLVSDQGNIGGNDGTGWSFGLQGVTGTPNVHAEAPNGDLDINPGDINVGVSSLFNGGWLIGGSVTVFGNGLVSQNNDASGTIVTSNLDIHALSDITLENANNAVSGNVSFLTPGAISFTNTLDTYLTRANNGLDSDGNILPATSIDITVHDPSGQTQPTLTIENGSLYYTDADNNYQQVSTSVAVSDFAHIYADGGITDLAADYSESAGWLTVGAGLIASSGGGDISLTNSANSIAQLEGSTQGGAFTMVTGSPYGGVRIGENGLNTGAGALNLTVNDGKLYQDAQSGVIVAGQLSLSTQDTVFNNCEDDCAPLQSYDIDLQGENSIPYSSNPVSLLATGNVYFRNTQDTVIQVSADLGGFQITTDDSNKTNGHSGIQIAQASSSAPSLLHASGDIINRYEPGPAVTASSLALVSDYGSIGNSLSPINLDVGTLQASAANGSIFLKSSQGFAIQNAGFLDGNGNVIGQGGLYAPSGDIHLNIIDTGGQISLTQVDTIQGAALSITDANPGEDIVLGNTGNTLSGTVIISGQGAVTFSNSQTTAFGAVSSAGSLNLSVNGDMNLYGPISAGDIMFLNADGNITQQTTDSSITATGPLLASSQFGSITLYDLGQAGDPTGCNGGPCPAIPGNSIAGYVNFNSYGDIYFANTRDTTLGVPLGAEAPAFTAGGTISVLVTNANQPSGNAGLTVQADVHAYGTGTSSFSAPGDLNETNGARLFGNNLSLNSMSGSIGGTGDGQTSFGVGSAGIGLNLQALAPNGELALNTTGTDGINVGVSGLNNGGFQSGVAITVATNGNVTQNSDATGTIVDGGTLDIQAGSHITLDNASNAVTGAATFKALYNINFTNTLDTVVNQADDGLDSNGVEQATSVLAITVHDPSGDTAPTLTLGNRVLYYTDANNNPASTLVSSAANVATLTADGLITDGYTPNSADFAGWINTPNLTLASLQGAIALNNPANRAASLVASTAGGNISIVTGSPYSGVLIGAGGINAGSGAVSLTINNAYLYQDTNSGGVTAGSLTVSTHDTTYDGCVSNCDVPNSWDIYLAAATNNIAFDNQTPAVLSSTGSVTFVNSRDTLLQVSAPRGFFNITTNDQNETNGDHSGIVIDAALSSGKSLLHASGDITEASSQVAPIYASSLALVSDNGSIGTSAAPVRLSSVGYVQASAGNGSVYLDSNQGFDIANAGFVDANNNAIGAGGITAADTASITIDSGSAGYALTQSGDLADVITAADLIINDQNTGYIGLTNTANAVTGNLTLTNAGGDIHFYNSPATQVANASASGTLTILSGGDLTLEEGAQLSSGASGDGAIVLSTTGAFRNYEGSDVLSMPNGGHFQIYSNVPQDDVFGDLDSGNTAIWDTNYTTGIAANGDRYGFVYQPTLTLTPSGSYSKTYGDTITDLGDSYTITGLEQGVSGAYLGDTASAVYSGAPTVGSIGAQASAYAGNYQLSLGSGTFTAGQNYAVQYDEGGLLVVNPATLTYTADAASRTYGSANPAFTGTVTGFVNSESQELATHGALSFGTTANKNTNVGSYAINGGGLTADHGNYVFVQASGNAAALTINPATLTYVADAQSRTYGAANPALTGAVTGFVNNDNQNNATNGTLSFTTAASKTSNVGSYAITGGGLAADHGNYIFVQAADNSTALTIDPATLTYVADTQSRIYGAANGTLTGTVTGFVNNDTQNNATTGTLSFSSTANKNSNVGSYAVTGSGLTADHGNYVFVQAAGNTTALTINPATLTYVADAQSRTYGASNPALTGTVTGFVNNDTRNNATTGTLGFGTAADAGSNVGAYAVTGSGLTADHGNYVFVQASGNATALTINPATLTYVADAQSRTYGAANPTLTGTVTGFVNGQDQRSATTGTLGFSATADNYSDVGSYAITGSGLSADHGNYVFVQAAGNAAALTINPATLTYVADAQSRIYGAANPSLTGTVTGFVNNESQTDATSGTLSFDTDANKNSNVGSYGITGSGLTAEHGNYVFVQGSGNASALTIDPATLTYVADTASRTYGDANGTLTGTVTGFVNNQT